MEEIALHLNRKTCRILIGQGILKSAGKIISELMPGGRFAIITNPTVNSFYGNLLVQSLEASGLKCTVFEIPDSETSKSLEAAQRLYSELTDKGFDRDSCVIGLGGGVVGDLAGFVAATYMRGIELIHVPTTLLAQVDSSIGGKTGVNISEGKNLVGTFHQPSIVLSDISTLKTLPDREFLSGMAEVVKYGIMFDSELFSMLEENMNKILAREPEIIEDIVTRCGTIKARIVEMDERDLGDRVILNYGHTLGHALESVSGYQYSHGEAVATGMVFAARIAAKFDLLASEDFERIIQIISNQGLPINIPRELDIDALYDFMKRDKKSRGGIIRFVLPTGIGHVKVWDQTGPEIVMQTLEEMQE